jgi:hypothetical protein
MSGQFMILKNLINYLSSIISLEEYERGPLAIRALYVSIICHELFNHKWN